MLKKGTFINRKYYKLCAAGMVGALANGINSMLDSILSGSQLGETDLTAVSIVMPLLWILYFVSSLYAPGYGMLYGKYNGAFETEEAYKTAGQMIITSVCAGSLMVLGLIALKQPFLQYYDCTGELYTAAGAYYNWKIVSAMLLPFYNGIYYLVAVDADIQLLSLGGITGVLANVVFSMVLCRHFGISGLGMGTCISQTLIIVVFSLHFLRKTNSIHFRFCFRIGEFREAVKLSSAIAISYLFIALTDIVMNKVILISCGVTMVTAYSVINLAYSFYDVYSAPFGAAEGFVAAFTGEKNNAGIRSLMKTTLKSIVWLGLLLSAVLLTFASFLPSLCGIETPEIVQASVKAGRLMALASIPYGISYVMVSLYPVFGKVKQGVVMSFFNDFLAPIALSTPLAFCLGFTGVSIGMALSSYLAIGLTTLWLRMRFGRKDFPLYLTDNEEEAVSYDLVVNDESIVELRDKVKKELDSRGYEIEYIELLMEELYKRISEKNPGRQVLSECTLLFGGDYVRFIVRDDGMIFNFVDENNRVESLNAHILNSFLEHVQDKEYILTTSFNRNGFVFKRN